MFSITQPPLDFTNPNETVVISATSAREGNRISTKKIQVLDFIVAEFGEEIKAILLDQPSEDSYFSYMTNSIA